MTFVQLDSLMQVHEVANSTWTSVLCIWIIRQLAKSSLWDAASAGTRIHFETHHLDDDATDIVPRPIAKDKSVMFLYASLG